MSDEIQVESTFVTEGGLQFDRLSNSTIKISRPGTFEEILTESEWASAKAST